MKIFLGLFLFSIHPFSESQGCTIFTLTGDRVLFGNNEDFLDLGTRMWFIPGSESFYGCMYVGFINGFAQGGLNEKGLAYDWVSGYYSEYSPSPGQKKGIGNLSQRMLETCVSVDDAIAFYTEYAEPAFALGRLFIADASGAAVIIQVNEGELEFLRSNAAARVLGYGESVFNKSLSENNSADIDNARDMLWNCRQEGEFATRYSTIYDLTGRDIYVYSPGNYEEGTKINLFAELSKGEHFYDIPNI